MNGEGAAVNYGAAAPMTADDKMKQVNKKFRVTGITTGLLSGLTYGIYTTLVLVAGYYEPLMSAAGVLAAPYVCSGLNDLFAGIWLTIYNARCGRLGELGRSLHTFPGKMIVLGSLLGGPIANGAYLVGLAMAGAYAIPISATCSLFGAIFAWIFLKQKPTRRVVAGMVIDVAVNLRELISGIVDLAVIVPLVGGMALLGGTFGAGLPLIWLALSGLSAAVSFVCWYKSNSTVGCAIGMSLNVTYAFWGVLFCVMFLGQQLTSTIVIGSIVIVFGAILVTMNPLDLLKKGE